MKRAFVWIIIILFLFSSGCVEKKTDNITKDTKAKEYVVYSIGNIPDSLLQLDDSKIRSKDMLLSLFEGLVRVDESGAIVPGLAESWSIGKDDITYTFRLRQDANWSDGTPITAEDFKTFFKDILNSKQSNSYAYQLYYIFGAQEYREDKKAFSGVAIKAVDEKTLEIRLNSPTSCFLEILSQPIYTLRKVDSLLGSYKKSYNDIAYSGPFVIGEVSDEGIMLEKNEYYYSADEVKSERLYITSSQGSEDSMAKFNTGRANLFINPPLSETQSMVLFGEAEVVQVDSGSSINFNLKKSGIISNSSFRKALSLAIDRDNLLQDNLSFIARSASTYIPAADQEEDKGASAKAMFNEQGDPELSQKLFKESKYDNKEKLKIVYLENTENKRLASAIVKDIKEDLPNISLSDKGYSETELSDILASGDYDMLIMNYALLYDDPISVLESWVSDSKLNLFSYKNSEFDSLIYRSKLEKDKSKRRQLLKDAEKILINDAPMIPVYFHNIILCKKSEVKGVYTTKEGNIKLDRAYMEIEENSRSI